MYKKDKKSRAVIANGPYGGAVLWWVGFALYVEIQDAGLDSLDMLGLDDAPDGLSIWEGYYTYDYTYDGDISMSFPQGDFRTLTEDEWNYVKDGKAPWDEADWMEDDEK